MLVFLKKQALKHDFKKYTKSTSTQTLSGLSDPLSGR